MARLPRAIVDIDEFEEPKNLMIYGDTGVGKTELVGHLPGKVLVLASEDNVRVIRRAAARLGFTAAEVKKRFKVWRIRTWADLEEAYKWLLENPGVFDWVVVDSATSVQQKAMRAAMEKAVKHNPEKRDIDLPDRGEHQKMQNAMKRMIADFNELPVNVLWLAQAMRREDKDGNEIVLPFLIGKDYEISAWACAQMQAFAFYAKRASKKTKGATERVLIWDSFADSNEVNYWAKDRYAVMPKFVLMARGDEQLQSFSGLLELIDEDPMAINRATKAVDERDEPQDDPEPGEDDEETTQSEPEDMGEDEATPEQERREELLGMDKAGLAEAAEAAGLEVKLLRGKKIGQVVDMILAAEAAQEDAADDADDEDEPEAEDEEPAAENGDEESLVDYTDRREMLESLRKPELVEAVEACGLKVKDLKGKSKSEVIDAIMVAEGYDLDPQGLGDDDSDDAPAEPEPEEDKAPAKRAAKKATGRFRPADEED